MGQCPGKWTFLVSLASLQLIPRRKCHHHCKFSRQGGKKGTKVHGENATLLTNSLQKFVFNKCHCALESTIGKCSHFIFVVVASPSFLTVIKLHSSSAESLCGWQVQSMICMPIGVEEWAGVWLFADRWNNIRDSGLDGGQSDGAGLPAQQQVYTMHTGSFLCFFCMFSQLLRSSGPPLLVLSTLLRWPWITLFLLCTCKLRCPLI